MIKKSTRILLSVALIVLMTVGTVFQTYAAPEWYKTIQKVVYIDGSWYIESKCINQLGNSCNMPGSTHYIRIPNFFNM